MTTPHERLPVGEDLFSFLAPHAFAVLTTYRNDETPVPTTIWFAYHQGKVYFTTQKKAGKAKRIRNSGRVTLTPSDRVGNVLGQPNVLGHAVELPETQYEIAQNLLKQKYGQQFEQITSGSDPSLRTYFVISPTS